MKMQVARRSRWTVLPRQAVVLGVVAVAGCVTSVPAPPPPPLDLQLVESAPLDLPVDCVATPGTLYRTQFEVRTDGSVAQVATAALDDCVRQALRRWVSTFSYAPVQVPTAVAFDWMLVTASRGD